MASEPEPPVLVDGNLSVEVLEYWLAIFNEVKLADDQTHYCIGDFLAFIRYNARPATRQRRARIETAGRPGRLKIVAAAG